MSRWGVRIVGVFFILVLLLMLFSIQRQLEAIARARGVRPAASAPSK